MNYKEITADEYEKLLQNKKDIFNNTFKNTNKLVEDKKFFKNRSRCYYLKTTKR